MAASQSIIVAKDTGLLAEVIWIPVAVEVSILVARFGVIRVDVSEVIRVPLAKEETIIGGKNGVTKKIIGMREMSQVLQIIEAVEVKGSR